MPRNNEEPKSRYDKRPLEYREQCPSPIAKTRTALTRAQNEAAAWAAAILDALHLLRGVRKWQAGLAGARRRLDAQRLDLVATCERLLRAVRDEAAAALPEARAEIRRDPAGWALRTIDAAAAKPKRGDGRGRATHVIVGTIGPEGVRLSPIVRPKQQAENAQPSVRRSYQKLYGPDGLMK
jgi:hypothetical protein